MTALCNAGQTCVPRARRRSMLRKKPSSAAQGAMTDNLSETIWGDKRTRSDDRRKSGTLTRVWRAHRPLNLTGADQPHHLAVGSGDKLNRKRDNVHTTGRSMGRTLTHRAGVMIRPWRWRVCLGMRVRYRSRHTGTGGTRVWRVQFDRRCLSSWIL